MIGDAMSEQLTLAGTDLKNSRGVEEFRFDDLPLTCLVFFIQPKVES
ncbi:hypothetical protein GCM10027256_33880 [Novispirillum itersonii subsp. nipponicum]